jgi:hypothetical protein
MENKMTKQDLEKCHKWLRSRMPLFSGGFQRKAAGRLAGDVDKESLPLLVEGLYVPDQEARRIAGQGIENFNNPGLNKDLFQLAVKKGSDGTAGWLQRQAVSRLARDVDKESLPLLVEALHIPDREARKMADASLRSLKDRELIDILCRMASKDPKGPVTKICLEVRMLPSDPDEACLFLVVTGQLDAYFKEDYQFERLHLAYERAESAVQGLVMEVIRSGDRRFDGFFGGRKKLSQCSEREIRLFIQSCLRHQDWPRLFQAFLELPTKYGFPLLDHFRTSQWEPEDAELRSLYRQAMAESQGGDLSEIKPPTTTSSVFERWLAEGKGEKWNKMSEQDLLGRLNQASFPEGVEIVAALANKVGHKEEAEKAVKNNPNWLVRLAGYETGLIKDFSGEAGKEDNYWVKELAGMGNVLEFWPVKATPTDLERMAAAPAEAFSGKIGAVRRVLRLLINRQVEVGVHEEMIIEAEETAAVMMEA